MRARASLAALEQRLVEVRAERPGGPEELAALVELATHLVPDPIRRGGLAREGAALAERLGDDAARLRCDAMFAEYLARHQHPADALQVALRTLAEAGRVGDQLARGQAHHSVAHCFEALDCIPEALEHVHQALSAYQAAGDAFGEGRILSSLAELYCELGEERRARDLFERAHDIFVEYGEPNGAAAMLVSISTIDRHAGDPAAAAVTIERSLDRYEQAGMPLDSAIAMATYAEALADLGRLDEAALWAKRGLDRNRMPDGSVSNPIYEINMLLSLAASVQLPQGDLTGARTTLDRAVVLAGEVGSMRLAASGHALLAEALRMGGDFERAYEHLRRSGDLTAEVNRAAHDRRVRALRVRFEVEHAEREANRYREEARVQAAAIAELERTKAELAQRMAELERLNAEIVQLSRTDPLTGIANRRLMTERLAEASRVTTRYGSPLSVVLFDVDHFKSINDEYGHAVGDMVLVTLVRLVHGCIRVTDLPARLGGDEFVVIMAGVTADEAAAAGERLRAAVRAHPWTQVAPGLVVRITVGVADGTGEGEPEKILRRADDALYRGKRAGRDTVSVDRGDG